MQEAAPNAEKYKKKNKNTTITTTKQQRSDERGTALFQWTEDKFNLNDGIPTRVSCDDQAPDHSSPDTPLVDADAEISFDWSVLNKLNSNHLLVLIK